MTEQSQAAWGPVTSVGQPNPAEVAPTQFTPEAVVGKAGDVGTKAVEGAEYVNGANEYDAFFDPNEALTDAEQIAAAAVHDTAPIEDLAVVATRQHIAKNIDLVQRYGSTMTGTPPESQYFNLPPKQ